VPWIADFAAANAASGFHTKDSDRLVDDERPNRSVVEQSFGNRFKAALPSGQAAARASAQRDAAVC